MGPKLWELECWVEEASVDVPGPPLLRLESALQKDETAWAFEWARQLSPICSKLARGFWGFSGRDVGIIGPN